MGNHGILRIVILLMIVVVLFGSAAPIYAADYELQDIMNGAVPGVTAVVNGSGGYWYGDSLRVAFQNNSSQSYSVRVPIGLRFVPANTNVQTMLTAGNEKFTVSPGQNSYLIKAFCGEKHDSAPSSSDVFTPGGFVDGDTLRTLREINRQETYDSNAQDAVWHNTDGIDISHNDAAVNLTGGGGPSTGEAAGAAAVMTALILAWALANGLGPDFRSFVADLIRMFTGGGGAATVPVEGPSEGPPEGDGTAGETGDTPPDDSNPPDDSTQSGGEEQKDDKSGTSVTSAPWSLINRPSPDHVWDDKTNSWMHRDDLEARNMRDQGYIWDGKNWIKPTIEVKPVNHLALRLESETSARNRLSNRWSEGEKKIGDYASLPSRLVAAVDEYNYQKHRMGVLDRLQRDAIDEANRVRDALRQAESEGKTELADYLRGQLDKARNNLERVNGARDNCSERMQVAADRILVRGVGATMQLGGKGASDAIGLSRTTMTAGRITNNLLDQARRGNLPGQRQVFRSTGTATEAGTGGTASDVARIKLRPGDKLFSDRPHTPWVPTPPAKPETSNLPVLKPQTGDKLLGGQVAGVYKGKNIIHKTIESDAVGYCDSNTPNRFYVDPNKVKAIASEMGARESAVHKLVCHHEHTHLEHGLFKTPMVNQKGDITITRAYGEPWNENLIRARAIGNKLNMETAVMQRMRMDYSAGKIPGVTPREFQLYEQWHQGNYQQWTAERDAYLMAARRSS